MTRRPEIDPRIATASRVEVVPIDELVEWDRNPHQGNDPELIESLRRFGQVTPIVRAPDGWIIAGNTTLRAMRALGFPSCAVVTLDASEAEQVAFGLASNRIGQLGEDDPAKLLALLQEIDVLEGTGWTLDDTADLTAMLEEIDRTESRTSINPETGTANDEPSLGEYLQGYQGHTVRSIVLDYEVDVFSWVVEHAETLRRQMGVQTNSALVVKMIAALTGDEAPAMPAEQTPDAADSTTP